MTSLAFKSRDESQLAVPKLGKKKGYYTTYIVFLLPYLSLTHPFPIMDSCDAVSLFFFLKLGRTLILLLLLCFIM